MLGYSLDVSELKAIGYYTLSKLEWYNRVGNNVKEFNYTNYHNFWKALVPQWLYKDILDVYEITTEDVLVEIARVKGDHAKDLHYHKISHAFCIILGENVGVENSEGSVQIDNIISETQPGEDFYFPTGCHHTFYGGEKDLYFLSIQNPPLLTKDNDDFYKVNL
jgi:mannose-6-phosphate isomerase-like protein (cupin superfamily)